MSTNDDPTTHPAPAAMARAAYPSDDRLSADQIGEAAAARLHYAAGVRAERGRLLPILVALHDAPEHGAGTDPRTRLRRLMRAIEASLQTVSAPSS